MKAECYLSKVWEAIGQVLTQSEDFVLVWIVKGALKNGVTMVGDLRSYNVKQTVKHRSMEEAPQVNGRW